MNITIVIRNIKKKNGMITTMKMKNTPPIRKIKVMNGIILMRMIIASNRKMKDIMTRGKANYMRITLKKGIIKVNILRKKIRKRISRIKMKKKQS